MADLPPPLRTQTGGIKTGTRSELDPALSESQRAMVAASLATMQQGARTDLAPSANLHDVAASEAAAMLGEPRPRTYLAGEEPWTADDLNEIAACGVFGVFRRMLKATERAAIACFANQKRRDDTESPFRWGTSHEPQYLAAGVIQDMQAAVDRLKEAAALEQGYWLNVDPDASSEARRLHKAGKFPWNRDKNSRALYKGKGGTDAGPDLSPEQGDDDGH